MSDHAIPSRAITVRQWLDLGRLVTHNARVHQMRRETEGRRSTAAYLREPMPAAFDERAARLRTKVIEALTKHDDGFDQQLRAALIGAEMDRVK